jgi:hypothetical protein
VALSGTLETFSLPDVLRLLSSTSKTGLLALDGDRGTGRIWVDGGAIVAAEADGARHADVDGVLFELLRFAEAAFEFDTTAGLPADAGPRCDVDAALEVAEVRLAEWHEIEAVVPSLDARVRLVPEVDGAVTVGADDWRLLARIGTGASGHDLAEHLQQGEYEVCSALRGLVEAGIVELTAVVEEAPVADPVTADEAVAGHQPVAEREPAVADAFEAMLHAPVPETPVFEVAADPEPVADAAEVMSDLAHLSPRAAAAVEATWGSDREPARDTDPEAEPREDDLNQNLLLRFLSSSKP